MQLLEVLNAAGRTCLHAVYFMPERSRQVCAIQHEPFQNAWHVQCKVGCRYEDMAEFEDAMGSSFKDFISKFPIIKLKEDDRVTDGYVFQVRSFSSASRSCLLRRTPCSRAPAARLSEQ